MTSPVRLGGSSSENNEQLAGISEVKGEVHEGVGDVGGVEAEEVRATRSADVGTEETIDVNDVATCIPSWRISDKTGGGGVVVSDVQRICRMAMFSLLLLLLRVNVHTPTRCP
jgi:hypothetical protein